MKKRRNIYTCMKCKTECERDDLTVKRSVFARMGAGGRVIKSRTLGFLCPSCLAGDRDFNRVALDDAPGHPGRRPEPVTD